MLQTMVEELEKVAENAKLRQEQSRSHTGTNEVIVISPTNNGQDLSAVAGELAALKNDATGRLSKAFQGSERFNRWGKHYVRALLRAHRLQICTNFMDLVFRCMVGKHSEPFEKLAMQSSWLYHRTRLLPQDRPLHRITTAIVTILCSCS